MTQQFETGCSSIDLSGPPFGVTAVDALWVRRNPNGTFDLFRDEACLNRFQPADLPVFLDVKTGLYFFIAPSSTAGTMFCDGQDGRPDPVTWPAADQPPPTITYGKILADRLAFSMMDWWRAGTAQRYRFDLMVEFEGTWYSILSNLTVEAVDPTIVEKGEEPPAVD